MSNDKIDNHKLALMRKEVAFIQSQQRGARRIKLEKGHTMLVRFLPAKMGVNNLWYVRIAQHWHNKLPITCPRLVGEDMGGNLENHCPVCALADQLNDDSDKIISDFGWKIKAGPQYHTWCLLYEKDDTALPMVEVLNPYEFRLTKTTWEELHGYYAAGARRCEDSVLDYRKGSDFAVIRAKNGIRLEKLDSFPFLDGDSATLDDAIKKIEPLLKAPRLPMPTEEQMESFAYKVRAAVDRLYEEARPAGRSRRSRVDEDSEERGSRSRHTPEEEDDAPPSSRRRAPVEEEDDAPRPSQRRSVPAEDEEGDDAPAPARRKAPAAEDEDEEIRPARRKAPAAEDDEAQPARRSSRKPEAEEEDDLDYSTKKSARSRQSEPDEKDPEKEADSESTGTPADENYDDVDPETKKASPVKPAAVRGKLEPTPLRAKELAAKAAAPDEEDDLPEDDKDPVPAAKSLPKPVDDEDEDGESAQAPPKVERKGKTADAVRSRLDSLAKR